MNPQIQALLTEWKATHPGPVEPAFFAFACQRGYHTSYRPTLSDHIETGARAVSSLVLCAGVFIVALAVLVWSSSYLGLF